MLVCRFISILTKLLQIKLRYVKFITTGHYNLFGCKPYSLEIFSSLNQFRCQSRSDIVKSLRCKSMRGFCVRLEECGIVDCICWIVGILNL